MIDNSNGRAWARFWLVAALVVSIIANVTHTVLADSEITLWLRVPGAVIWPAFTFAGIEIVTRIIWERRLSHYVARFAVMAPAVAAAITSYEHQFNLLGMMGERHFIQVIGPVAIDGLMIGCTMTLLFTRVPLAPKVDHSLNSIFSPTPPADERDAQREADEILAKYETELQDIPDDALALNDGHDLHRLLQKSPELDPSASVPRAPRSRATTENATRAILLLMEGKTPTQAAKESGAGTSTVYKYAAALAKLREVPDAEITNVSPELVKFMREKVKTA